jgi:uncharacterized membrane protein YdfJ with MMPL/SSD domain
LFVRRRPLRVVAAWVVAIVVGLVLAVTLLPGSLTSEGHVTNNPESLRGYAAIARHFPRGEEPTELVVVRRMFQASGLKPSNSGIGGA